MKVQNSQIISLTSLKYYLSIRHMQVMQPIIFTLTVCGIISVIKAWPYYVISLVLFLIVHLIFHNSCSVVENVVFSFKFHLRFNSWWLWVSRSRYFPPKPQLQCVETVNCPVVSGWCRFPLFRVTLHFPYQLLRGKQPLSADWPLQQQNIHLLN